MNVKFNPIMMDYIKDLFDLREKLLSDDDLENYQEVKERYDFLAGIVLSLQSMFEVPLYDSFGSYFSNDNTSKSICFQSQSDWYSL